ncbi:mucin-2-like [Scylla paramamosain]
MVTKAVSCESSVRQVTEASVSGPDQEMSSNVLVTETHTTHQQTNTLTAADLNTPSTYHQTEIPATVPPNTPTTHQQTNTHTTTDTNTPAAHHQTETTATVPPNTPTIHQQTNMHTTTDPNTPTIHHTDTHTDLNAPTTHHFNTYTPTSHQETVKPTPTEAHTTTHTTPKTETHTTTHTIPETETHTTTHTIPETETHTTTHTIPETETHTTTHTIPETETHTTTHRHQLAEAQGSRELVTAQNDTGTVKAMEEETESQTETHSDAKDSEKATEKPTEPQDQSEIQIHMPFTAPQENETQETHTEETEADTALHNEAVKKTQPDPQTQTMMYLEVDSEKPGQADTTREGDTETQGLPDSSKWELKASEDKLLPSIITTITDVEMETEKPVQADTPTDSREGDTETQEVLDSDKEELKAPEEDGPSGSTTTEDEHLDTTPGTSKQPSRKTGSRVTRSRAVPKNNVEDTVPKDLQNTNQEEQDVENVEETPSDNQEETRVTRKSLRVKAKTSPKCHSSVDSTRASLRSNRKRKSDSGESSVKNTKRRTSTRL